jgi:hypothetical protein
MEAPVELMKRDFGTNGQTIGFGEIAPRISVAARLNIQRVEIAPIRGLYFGIGPVVFGENGRRLPMKD